MENRPKLAVSVVIGANERLIFDCLDSLFKYSPPIPMEVYVIANPSSEETIKKLQEKFPGIYVIRNQERKGFAYNHNQVLKKTKAPYVLITNDDVIFLPSAIEKMISYMEAHPDVGMVGPKLLNPDLTLQRSRYGYPTLFRMFLLFTGIRKLVPFSPFVCRLVTMGGRMLVNSRFWDHNETCEVDAFRGAVMLVRREAVKEVGFMSEVTYVYEEIEWQYRFKKKNWKVVFLHEAEVIHLGGQTVQKTPGVELERVKATLYFFHKHRSKRAFIFLRILLGCIFAVRLCFACASLQFNRIKCLKTLIKTIIFPDLIFVGKQPLASAGLTGSLAEKEEV